MALIKYRNTLMVVGLLCAIHGNTVQAETAYGYTTSPTDTTQVTASAQVHIVVDVKKLLVLKVSPADNNTGTATFNSWSNVPGGTNLNYSTEKTTAATPNKTVIYTAVTL